MILFSGMLMFSFRFIGFWVVVVFSEWFSYLLSGELCMKCSRLVLVLWFVLFRVSMWLWCRFLMLLLMLLSL